MAHRLAPRAKADLEELALYVFVETGSLEIATRLVDSITGRFVLLGTHPSAGRRRDDLAGHPLLSRWQLSRVVSDRRR